MKKHQALILLIIILYLTIAFFRLDELPGEWFGDISNVHEYVTQILRGEWPFYFFQSAGPLYHYLIAPIVLLYRNHGFETYKAASIAVSILGLVATFLFVAEISSIYLAFITVLTMSFSLWYLIWSRLGNSQIVIPVLVCFMSLFIARFVKKRRFTDLFLAAVFASLGWYTYPQTFIFPLVFFIFVIFYLVIKKKLISQFKSLVIIFIALVIMAIPFVNMVKSDKGNFGPQGYVGGKVLPNLSLHADQLIGKTLSNYMKVLLMLHVKGDGTFRVNVSKHPQIDAISGVFFLLGFLYFAKRKRRIWLFFILFMLLTLPLPSVSPVIPDAEIPNSARTIAVVPFVFLLVSAGFLWVYQSAKKFLTNDKYLLSILLSVMYIYMVFTNLKLYFVDYANGLPDRNFATGKIIAEYIDSLPKDVNVYFGSCCWGQSGHPEPKAVAYILRKERDFIEYNQLINLCREIKRLPAIIIFGPKDNTKKEGYKTCFPNIRIEDFSYKMEGIIFRIGILQ